VSARTKARKRAIDLLYAADLRRVPVAELVLAEAMRAAGEPQREASWLYARELVDGVTDHQTEIDEMIETYSTNWPLSRMPVIDRAILRIAVWEILHNDEIPPAVAIDEAVEHAKQLSTEDSAGFVNGLLGRIAASAG
jgi:N utilization substance protein B